MSSKRSTLRAAYGQKPRQRRPIAKKDALTPGPDGGYTVEHLAAAADVSPRTIRHYTALGLLEAPPFQGYATRYTREHLERVLAIQKLRKRGLSLTAIRQKLAKEAEAAQEAMAKQAALPAQEAPPLPTSPTPLAPSPPAAPSTSGFPAERWERVLLVPGLELLVNSASGPIVRRLAGEIYANYALGAPPAEEETSGSDRKTTAGE